MGKNSGISWTHHTFNPWWGCEKPLVQIGEAMVVSPECVKCYAETFDGRCGGAHWGRTAPRREFGEKHWAEPFRWNQEARMAGERHRVFCLSMGDVLEDRRDLDALRQRLWPMIKATQSLDWMLLTKRAELLLETTMVPSWVWELPNVWPGVTPGVQETANLRVPHLVELKKRYPHLVAWVSGEPLLGRVDFMDWMWALDLVIVGGESGPKARPMEGEWAVDVRDQCKAAGVAFFFKQWGGATAKSGGDVLRGQQYHEMPQRRAA